MSNRLHVDSGHHLSLVTTTIGRRARRGPARHLHRSARGRPAYAVRILAEPASTSDEDVAELREHGWSDRIIADTVELVSLNLLTGSFNLVAGLEPLPAEQSTKEIPAHVH